MSEGDSAAVGRIIANTIKEPARRDPDALASRIVAPLAEAGFLIGLSSWDREEVMFATDSPLEEGGFELVVPL